MKYLTSAQLRAKWNQFWKARQHYQLPSSSLVSEDPSLLWVNSGIAGIKNYFLGVEKPPANCLFNIQKAVRTNDLVNIGLTNRHLSFFEMMGNFSIGAYFKVEALSWAWEFLTAEEQLGLATEKLYVTYYEKDAESLRILKEKLKIPDSHLIAKSRETNFWDLGVGPCGPNLEFFYDLGPQYDPSGKGLSLLKEDKENDRYLEIWNIVFSEFLNLKNNQYQKLPTKNIDTGAGLERLITVLQGKNNCFETDIFTHSLKKLEYLTQKSYLFKLNDDLSIDEQRTNQQMKIILDHLRTATFLLTDSLAAEISIDFQNQRNYVIRKLIRIAILQFSFLKKAEPFIRHFFPAILADMATFYPDLKKYASQTLTLLEGEEKLFLKLLCHQEVQKLIKNAPAKLTGETIFRLVTSVGIPLAFIEKIAETKKIILELAVFDKLWKEHQKISQKTTTDFVKNWKMWEIKNKPATFFDESVDFLNNVPIIGIFHNGKAVKKIKDQTTWIIFEKTPFYAESGGQEFDIGSFSTSQSGGKVLNVQRNHKQQFLHQCEIRGELNLNDLVNLKIDSLKRKLTRNNHSGTHLLHSALRHLISSKIHQTGSFNNEKYLRLDFFAPQKLNFSELISLEKEVNRLIKTQIKTEIIWTTKREAEKNKALAFFEEFYDPKRVRMVKFADYSIELCGGTHVSNTSDIGKFLITRFETVSRNNYRIYAVTSQKTTTAIADFHTQFQKWWKKNQINISSFAKLISTQELYQKIMNKDNSLLEMQQNEKLLKNEWKKNSLAQKTSILKKTLQNYEIPSRDFQQFSSTQFLFHVIKTSTPYQEDLLWKLFDQNRNIPQIVLCLLLPLSKNSFRFVFYDNRKNKKLDWKNFLQKKFTTRIKVGGITPKIQGIIHDVESKDFRQFLQNQLV